MGASQTTEVQVFSGGINLVPAPHLLNQQDSRTLANVNLRKGNMTPFATPLFIENASGNYVYHFEDDFHYYELYRSNVLYNRIWYWTSIASAGKRYPDGTIAPLGIKPPVTTPLAVPQTATNGLEGAMSYVYTYFDPKSGSESPPSPPSIPLDLTGDDAGQAVMLTNLAPSPDGYLTRIYRIGGLQTMYTAVITLPESTEEYLDSLQYTELESMILDTARAYPPPTGLQYLTESKGRFYGAVGAELYYTPIGKPDSWYALDVIPIDDTITGIVSVANGLIVMSKHKTKLLTGTNPIQFALHTLSNSSGCISPQTIAVQDGKAIWLSSSGFIMSDGSYIENVSLHKLGRLTKVEPFGAVFVDRRYLMSFGGTLYPSNNLLPSDELHPSDVITESGFSLPKGAVVIDFSTGQPAFSTITDVIMGVMVEAEDRVYHITSDGLQTSNIKLENSDQVIVTESGASNIVAETEADATLSETFKGGALREIKYRSPVYTEQAIGVLKSYEKVRVVYSGIGTIRVFDEDGRLFTEQLLSATRRVSEWVYIPVIFNRGYGIQFLLEGTFVVDSIQWVWTPKEAQ